MHLALSRQPPPAPSPQRRPAISPYLCRMAGIYLHIPFCRQACHYCNFHFSTSLQRKNDFIDALLKEMEARRDYIGDARIQTIYFGGGTPSLLSEEELERILNKLHTLFSIAPDAELTLEANP